MRSGIADERALQAGTDEAGTGEAAGAACVPTHGSAAAARTMRRRLARRVGCFIALGRASRVDLTPSTTTHRRQRPCRRGA